jgi:histidine triad (HIT) family protein
MCARAVSIARELGLPGYRLVINTGAQGGQTVGRLHLHLLGAGR